MERWKPPHKRDLLPKKEPGENITKESLVVPGNKEPDEDEGVRQARNNAEVAISHDRQREAEIKTELREKGYQGVEDGLADIKRMKEEADKLLLSARSKEESAKALLLDLDEQAKLDKKKYLAALSALTSRESDANARLKRSKEIESKYKSTEVFLTTSKNELKELIIYHQTNIAPCLNALKTVSKSIYNWTERLRDVDDFLLLYYHIRRIITTVESYIEKMKSTKTIPS